MDRPKKGYTRVTLNPQKRCVSVRVTCYFVITNVFVQGSEPNWTKFLKDSCSFATADVADAREVYKRTCYLSCITNFVCWMAEFWFRVESNPRMLHYIR